MPAYQTDRTEHDPRPIAPVRPGSEDCCHSGCNPCVFELYEDALERYSAALQAWEERNRQTGK